MPFRQRKLCKTAHSEPADSIRPSRIHDIVTYRDFRSPACICQDPSPSPKSEFEKPAFDVKSILDSAGLGRKVVQFRGKETVLAQGNLAENVMYLQEGGVRLSELNGVGKEAVVAILGPGDFFGEACLAGQSTCMTTATAIGITAVSIIDKHEMIRALHEEHEFSDRFFAYMLTRNIRVEEDLMDQLSTPARNAWRGLCCCWRATVQ
jgi:CRP-like cAMP-binding protein